MRRILHLSDLHFGRTRPELLDPLVDTINSIAPDIVVMSGDYTQRARVSQYQEARAFLDRLRVPVLSVPGNHDTPLDNLWLRFIRPWTRYKRYISTDLEPVFADAEVHIVGVNTVNRFAWQRGKIGRHTVNRVCAAFNDPTSPEAKIVALHHPLEHMEDTDKRLTRGANDAVEALGQCGADIVLSGHLHSTVAAPFTAAPGVLFVQAGTGLSTRLRGETNTFNLLTIDGDQLQIDRYSAETEPVFAITATSRFLKSAAGWQRLSAAE